MKAMTGPVSPDNAIGVSRMDAIQNQSITEAAAQGRKKLDACAACGTPGRTRPQAERCGAEIPCPACC